MQSKKSSIGTSVLLVRRLTTELTGYAQSGGEGTSEGRVSRFSSFSKDRRMIAHSLSWLEQVLGYPERLHTFSASFGPAVVVRWRCGCRASGRSVDALVLYDTCDLHLDVGIVA
jgi:hypothetical protein